MSQWEWVNSQKGQKKTYCLSLTATVSSYIFLCPLRHSFPRSLLSTWHPLTGYQILVFSVHSSFLWGLESCLKYQSLKTESGQPILAFIRFLSLGDRPWFCINCLLKTYCNPYRLPSSNVKSSWCPVFPKEILVHRQLVFPELTLSLLVLDNQLYKRGNLLWSFPTTPGMLTASLQWPVIEFIG